MDGNPVTTSQPAAPAASPATAAPALLSPQEMTKDQWQKARETGDFPTKPSSSDADADSSTAAPVAQAASTDASTQPASEPGKPAKKKGLQARSEEVDRELSDLKRKLEIKQELERQLNARPQPKQDAKTDPSPAATKAEWQRFAELPDAPKEDAFDKYGDYTAAMALFIADKRFEERDQQSQQRSQYEARERHVEQVHATARDRAATYFEQHPDAKAKVDPALLAIPPLSTLDPRTVDEMKQSPEGVQMLRGHWLLDRVLESEVPGPLLVHFSSEQGQRDWQRLIGLPSSAAVTRALGSIEARLSTGSPAPVHTSSSAPAPPTTLGKRPAAPVDELKAAQDSGDFRRFKAAYNAQHATA